MKFIIISGLKKMWGFHNQKYFLTSNLGCNHNLAKVRGEHPAQNHAEDFDDDPQGKNPRANFLARAHPVSKTRRRRVAQAKGRQPSDIFGIQAFGPNNINENSDFYSPGG